MQTHAPLDFRARTAYNPHRMMDPVLVLMAPGFEEIEFTAPVDILRRLDVPVVTAGLAGRRVEGAHGLTMEADMLLVDVDASLYSAVILPGGAASWTLRDTPAVLKLVREMHAAGKLVAAICAAPMALAKAGVLAGRRATCYPAAEVEELVRSAAAELCTCPAVTDGNVITGRGPGAALEFGFALGRYLGQAERVETLRAEMCAL